MADLPDLQHSPNWNETRRSYPERKAMRQATDASQSYRFRRHYNINSFNDIENYNEKPFDISSLFTNST